MLAPGVGPAGSGAGNQRDHRSSAPPARARRRRRRGRSWPAPIRATTLACSETWMRHANAFAPPLRQVSASVSTATTTRTGSAPRRSPSSSCGSSAQTCHGTSSRFEEGYGVSGETLDRLAGDGCALVVTVDCGITAVSEVARARELGLDVVVTDHHRPGEELPDSPIVATRPSDYPFPALRHRGPLQARSGAPRPGVGGAAAAPGSGRDRDDLRRRPARGREPVPRAGRAESAGADAEAGAASADALGRGRPGRRRRRRGRVPSGAPDQRSGAALASRDGAAAHRGRHGGLRARRPPRG